MLRIPVIVILSAAACTHSKTTSPTGGLCDALAISAEESKLIREEVVTQMASADRAMTRWKAWQDHLVRPEQNAVGEYSGAEDDARDYESRREGLCAVAKLNDAAMAELGKQVGPVEGATRDLYAFDCGLKPSPLDSTPEQRVSSAREWAARSRRVRDAEDDLVLACYQKFGGERPIDWHLARPTMLSD